MVGHKWSTDFQKRSRHELFDKFRDRRPLSAATYTASICAHSGNDIP